MPKMKHPDSSRAIEVGTDQVPLYESQGWEKAPAPAKKTAAKTTAAKTTSSTTSTSS